MEKTPSNGDFLSVEKDKVNPVIRVFKMSSEASVSQTVPGSRMWQVNGKVRVTVPNGYLLAVHNNFGQAVQLYAAFRGAVEVFMDSNEEDISFSLVRLSDFEVKEVEEADPYLESSKSEENPDSK